MQYPVPTAVGGFELPIAVLRLAFAVIALPRFVSGPMRWFWVYPLVLASVSGESGALSL
ncbi:hypothetical protein [Halochromatium sp.]